MTQGPQVAGPPPTPVVHVFFFAQSASVAQVTLHAAAEATQA